jgi:hypothetical protein
VRKSEKVEKRGSESFNGREMIKWSLTLVLSLITGCTPSMQYQLGEGFYSDTLSKAQVDEAVMAGRVERLGRFSVSTGGCFNFNFTSEGTDRALIIPAVREKLQELHANAADKVGVRERFESWWDLLASFLLVPGLLGCSAYTITGDALSVHGGR